MVCRGPLKRMLCLLGSSRVFKAAGSEIVSSRESLGNGIVSVAAARLPGLTKELTARLSGNWVSVLLYRRCRSSLVDSFFASGASCELDHAGGDNQIVPLQRKCAQELAMLAAVSPLIFTNVFVWYYSRVYASDSSSRSGALLGLRLESMRPKTCGVEAC
jgi:hypothetical protein